MSPKILKVLTKIAKLERELYDLQQSCPHKNVTTTRGANSGNYDPMDDCYWVDVYCNDCDCHMSFDSKEEPEKYRFYV